MMTHMQSGNGIFHQTKGEAHFVIMSSSFRTRRAMSLHRHKLLRGWTGGVGEVESTKMC